MAHGGCNGHTLCPPQLEHTLHIFAKEGGFDGKVGRLVLGNQSADGVEDELQFFVAVFYLSGFKHTHFKQRGGMPLHGNKAVAHYNGAGVDAEYYFRVLLQTGLYFYNITRLMKLNRNIKSWNYRKFINYFLGPILFLWLSWSIYNEIRNQPNLEAALEVFSSAKLFYFIPVVLLMVLNWSIEAIKWKLSVKPIQPIGFLKAFRAVLSGVSFSVSTPNRIGEYLGRVLYMDEGNRLRTISMTMVGSLSQLIITILMGAAGLIIMKRDIEAAHLVQGLWLQVIIYGVLTVLAVLTVFYFRLSWLVRLLNRLPGSKRFLYLVQTLEELDATLLLRLLSFSLLRYIVFIVQYYLLFQLFDVNIGMWQTFWTVSVTFLVMAVIPTFAIAELAQRGYVAKMVVGIYSGNIAGIIFATTGIWFINLVLPAIAGSLLILGIKKLYKEEDEQT